MKAISVASALLATAAQVALFIGLWTVAFYVARSQGRVGHSDIGFGITITYGVFLIGLLCLISSVIATSSPKKLFKWIAVGLSSAIWSFWMIPSFDDYPYRAPTYFGIGCVVLVGGSIFLAPSIMRGLQSRLARIKTGEQAVGGNLP